MPLIEYNGSDIFAGQLPPLASMTTSFTNQGGGRTSSEDTITLKGTLTGCGMGELVAARNSLASSFDTNFKNLVVGDLTFEKVKLKSISFDQSDYVSTVGYSISFSHTTGFQIAEGVISASNQYTYTENADQTITMRQSISAKGVNTPSTSALDNATNFVNAQKEDFPRPSLMSTAGSEFGGCLTDVSTTVDKINNTVSVDRSFKTDPGSIGGGTILRYTKEISETEGEPVRITYAGTADGCRNGSMPSASYNDFKDGIEGTILDETVTEDPGINRVTFSFSYQDKKKEGEEEEEPDTSPDVTDDFTITISEDSTSSLVNTCINGTISSKKGCVGKRMGKVRDVYTGEEHGFNMVQEIYNTFYAQGSVGNPGVSLNPQAVNNSTSDDETAETLSYNACYSDRADLDVDSCDDDNLNGAGGNYTLQCEPSIRAIRAVASAATGKWIIKDLGYNTRGRITVSTTSKGGAESARNLAWAKINEMVTDSKNMTTDIDGSTINGDGSTSVTLGVSFISSSSATSPSDSYKTITSFDL